MSELQSTRKAADYALRRRALSHRTRGSANLPQEPDRRSSPFSGLSQRLENEPVSVVAGSCPGHPRLSWV